MFGASSSSSLFHHCWRVLYGVHNFCLPDDNLLLGSPLGSLYVYTAVSTKVVPKKRESVRDNAER